MEKVWIRDGKKSDPGSGINIPDPQHCKIMVQQHSVASIILLEIQHGIFVGAHLAGHLVQDLLEIQVASRLGPGERSPRTMTRRAKGLLEK
jgi:hypothetical protein